MIHLLYFPLLASLWACYSLTSSQRVTGRFWGRAHGARSCLVLLPKPLKPTLPAWGARMQVLCLLEVSLEEIAGAQRGWQRGSRLHSGHCVPAPSLAPCPREAPAVGQSFGTSLVRAPAWFRALCPKLLEVQCCHPGKQVVAGTQAQASVVPALVPDQKTNRRYHRIWFGQLCFASFSPLKQ